MATEQTRPFSTDYSGLATETVLGALLATICITSHHLMKRRRRGLQRKVLEASPGGDLGSVETWEFGYLFQGRSWALYPSPPIPLGWPLSWVKSVMDFPEESINQLRGVDATLYCRFLRGTFWFIMLHTFTTAAILLPIHIVFSAGQYPASSMNRALISALVTTTKGQSLLWIHMVLLIWLSATWIFTLLWICKGVFYYRAISIEKAYERAIAEADPSQHHMYAPHPHPQHPFHAMPPLETDRAKPGLRLRTIMVTNIPPKLRSDAGLTDYFQYYMSRSIPKPSLGITSSTQPGLIDKLVSFALNAVKRWRIFTFATSSKRAQDQEKAEKVAANMQEIEMSAAENAPVIIEQVSVVRKMTELASLIDRREEVLKRLETAHIKLAERVLEAVKNAILERSYAQTPKNPKQSSSREKLTGSDSSNESNDGDARHVRDDDPADNDSPIEAEDRMALLIRTIGPFVKEFGLDGSVPLPRPSYNALGQLSKTEDQCGNSSPVDGPAISSKSPTESSRPTIWDALFSLPRSALDPYQPLIHLKALFRGKAVPTIDYYTTKLGLLASLIQEARNRPVTEHEAASTAFVTFANPDHARRAKKYLAVHPKNPLACLVCMAPEFEDLDWVRVMKSTYRAEYVRDWVVELGVWAFTIVWIIPVSFFVGLFTIKNISTVLPGLENYLNSHKYTQTVITSLLPTVLTSALTLLIPLVLLLIAKKAHTINTLSSLHDRILMRYHKFLVSNILIFFCLGTTALESFFTSFRSSASGTALKTVSQNFPAAGPFYVEWLTFTTAMHGGLELALFGLPLILYPATKRQVTPRKRAVGIRPRTFNYYYWLPNHLLIIFISFCFALLNPFILPFALIYFAVERVVIKNQLIHVYAKNYEGNGRNLLIRLMRYSMDGLVLAQVVFLALMAVTSKIAQVAITAIMIFFTLLLKIILTRIIKAKFDEAEIYEAHLTNGSFDSQHSAPSTPPIAQRNPGDNEVETPLHHNAARDIATKLLGLKLPRGLDFTYSALPDGLPSPHSPSLTPVHQRFPRLHSWNGVTKDMTAPGPRPMNERTLTMPALLPAPQPVVIFTPPRVASPLAQSEYQPHPLVVPHSKHPAWDDSARLDRPYDNPYYVRPLHNHLWLPRNPVGILDLDDTVDVFQSLTSEPGAGKLGELRGEEGEFASGLPSTFSTSEMSEIRSITSMSRRQLTGAEEIELPPVIASRVSQMHQERDVDAVDDQRPSVFMSRIRKGSQDSTMLRRPSMLSIGSKRTLSASSSHRPGLDAVLQSVPESPAGLTRRRVTSTGESRDAIVYPPSPKFAASTMSRQSRRPRRSSSIAIPERQALIEEVIAEEVQIKAAGPKEEPENETGKQRSWMTSWMYSHRPWRHGSGDLEDHEPPDGL